MSTTVSTPTVGSKLPDIPLTGSTGTTSSLGREIAGPAVVFFMRTSTCPICHAHIRTLERMLKAGQLGTAQVIIVVPGNTSEAKSVARTTTLSVWASGEHHADVGLGRSLMLQHSGTFVVDASGGVLSAVTSALPTGSFSKSAVIEALARA